MNWSWMLPPSYSTFGPDVDRMYYIILWITGIVFVITEVLMVYFLVKYRHREGHKAEFIHGNTKAEITWTLATFFIVIAIGIGSLGQWNEMKSADSIPADAMEIRMMGSQFEWIATYPGPDGQLGTADDFTIRNRLVVPVDQAVSIRLEAEDVIHSLFLPEMRVKQDAVPGMQIPVWFEAVATGEYTIACAELCGIGHTTMGGTLEVLSVASYQTWLSEQIGQAQQQ